MPRVTRTADPYIPVPGIEDPIPEDFREVHGYKSGYGLVTATAAVAARFYLLLNTGASLAEAAENFEVVRTIGGRLALNPGCGSVPVLLDPGLRAGRELSSVVSR